MFTVMKNPRLLLLYLGLITVTTQDAVLKKNCDCKLKQVHALATPIVSLQFQNENKSSCNICSHRKEMLRKEKEKELQFQKCPFEILGTPSMKGKTSEELLDGFRELLVPSQNGFFDMLRGVVKTIHVSSESELKWAKEKEAKLLAQKKLMEREKRRKILEEQKEAVDIKTNMKEEKAFELVDNPRKELSPFLRALFKIKDSVGAPRNSDVDYGMLQYTNEEEASNLQNLDSTKNSNDKPDSFYEIDNIEIHSAVSENMAENNLLGLAPICKKKEIF